MPRLDELILFDTEWGRYKITRRERHRLAILHGLPDAKAAELAHRADPVPGPARHGFSADYLADAYTPDGRWCRATRPHNTGLRPAILQAGAANG